MGIWDGRAGREGAPAPQRRHHPRHRLVHDMAEIDRASGLQTDRFEAGLEVADLLQIRGALGTGPDIADGDVLHLGPPVLAVLSSTGGVPWVWKDSIVLRPQAWPFLRSSSVQVIGFQSGARISRAPALATSTRLPPGSYT